MACSTSFSYNDSIIAEMIKLGPITERQAAIALQVFLELCEEKRYYEITYKFERRQSLLYLKAKKTPEKKGSFIFIPIPSTQLISFNQMSGYLNITHQDIEGLFLVFVSEDSTTVYYQISNGLPKTIISNSEDADRKKHVDNIIRKNRTQIAEAALCQTPITITPVDQNKDQPL